MFKLMIKKLKNTFYNLDKKILKILKYGLIFCLFISIVSVAILLVYLFLLHNVIIYEIGIRVFEISLYFTFYFIASAITVDTIVKKAV